MTAGLHPRTISFGTPTIENLRTWANGVTLLRTVAGLALFATAAIQGGPTWNLTGLVTYAGLDVLDRFLASDEVQTVPSPETLSLRLRRWARSFGHVGSRAACFDSFSPGSTFCWLGWRWATWPGTWWIPSTRRTEARWRTVS